MTRSRRDNAYDTRLGAAEVAKARPVVTHRNNNEEQQYRRRSRRPDLPGAPSYIASFTKGLPHDPSTGLLLNPADYQQFIDGIRSGSTTDFEKTPLGPATGPTTPGALSVQSITATSGPRDGEWTSQIAKTSKGKDGENGADVRAWESQAAGLIYDLEGPDAQAVTMPPAPTLTSPELAAEMAEVYLMALLRDQHFSQLRTAELGDQHEPPGGGLCGKCQPEIGVEQAIDTLRSVSAHDCDPDNHRNWFEASCCDLTDDERRRHRGPPERHTLFRGIAPGDDVGPYLSQFLLIGNPALGGDSIYGEEAGCINYGAIRIDQRVRVATPCKDYMTTFEAWVDVQNGADLRGAETYERKPAYRFMTTPRDLATYVHYDALYEAYLNACLIMLGMGVPFDPGLPFQGPDVADKQQGFASFGGPHILSLVTEVATRALKAVRYQKFNVHRRLRPEAVGGLIDRWASAKPDELRPVEPLHDALGQSLLGWIAAHNECQNQANRDRSKDASCAGDRYLLPMAFPEGSPMHPAYGAGHATVAGACVTILKAYFDHGHPLLDTARRPIAYEPNAGGTDLVTLYLDDPLTVEGELNKLAANIAIGRNWAGVHYFTDYIESLRMGEAIALGILEEQRLTYGENFAMTVPLFDGGSVQI